jgi:hypothetical protein
MQKFQALARATFHTSATLVLTLSVWAVWIAWRIFIQGKYRLTWGLETPWEVYIFGMYISLFVVLILAGIFLVLSLIYHILADNISKQNYILSSLTLASTSLVLWLVLPDGGLPLILLFIILPIIATLWLRGNLVKPHAD